MPSQISITAIYFLEVFFLKYWNYLVASDDPEKKDVLASEVRYMQKFDVVLFLYFPKMKKAASPKQPRQTSQMTKKE